MITNVIKVLVPATLAFAAGILITPAITHFLYKHKLWKKKAGKTAGYGGGDTPIFNRLHDTRDTGTPRMGGIVVWFSVALVTFGICTLALLTKDPTFEKLNFLSRNQTLIPLALLLGGALVGFIDDLLIVRGSMDHFAGGLSLTKRLAFVTFAALFSGWWFFDKLDTSSIGFPFIGQIDLGVAYIIVYILVALAVYASSVIDGIDGLSGGVFASIFAAYASIAFSQAQVDLAAFCATIVGGLLAFLWFNVPPARFYMSETGMMALTLSLTAIAFLTDKTGEGLGVFVLPIIALPLVITVGSNIIQIIAKKKFGRKIFLVAPLHHHFEALGWPAAKVTMRYWIISIVCAFFGVVIALVG